MHLFGLLVLIVGDDPTIREKNVAAIPPVVVSTDGHQSGLAAGEKGLLNGRVVAFEVRVAVQNKKSTTEVGQGSSERASCTERPRTVEDISQRDSPTRTVTQSIAHHLAE